MSSVFRITLRPVLILGQLFGLINISYTLESTGFIMRTENSTYYGFLELVRMLLLIIFTYIIHERGIFYIQQFRLVKFWIIIISARLSEIWMIKLINGIIEFDQNVSLLPPEILIHQRSQSKTRWNIIMVILFSYFIVYYLLDLYFWPPQGLNITTILIFFFEMPYITDYVVLITVCYYLSNLGCRFQILNDFWKCLPAGLAPVPDKWTHFDIAMSVENIRLLHAELSELLKTFDSGFGLLLLCFFVCSFIDMIYVFYLMLYHEFISDDGFIDNVLKYMAVHIFNIQVVVFTISIAATASWINEKKMEIISYLRLNRISNLPIDTKLQIRMFMNQISISGYDEMTAYGFFSVNLNLLVSILMLTVTGIATLIQMKNHPIIYEMYNNTMSYHTGNW